MAKKVFIITGIFVALVAMLIIAFRTYTKSFSPEDTVTLRQDDLEISIKYSRPYKNDRMIFGDIVPYDKVWRTGANEATVFSTDVDLQIKGQILPAGKYSLWTIPSKEVWTVIWNSDAGQWGVNPFDDLKANRDPSNDQLTIETAVIETSNVFEQFTIDLDKISDDIHMVLMWDQTMIVVPMKIANKQVEM